MDEDLALVTPDLDDIPEDDDAEPEDASVDHVVGAEQLELELDEEEEDA